MFTCDNHNPARASTMAEQRRDGRWGWGWDDDDVDEAKEKRRGTAEMVVKHRMPKEKGDHSLMGNDHHLIKWSFLLFRVFVPVFWPTGGGGGHGSLEKAHQVGVGTCFFEDGGALAGSSWLCLPLMGSKLVCLAMFERLRRRRGCLFHHLRVLEYTNARNFAVLRHLSMFPFAKLRVALALDALGVKVWD